MTQFTVDGSIASITKAASTDKLRTNLNTVHFTVYRNKPVAVATDGHILAVRDVVVGDGETFPSEPLTVPAGLLDKAAKAARKAAGKNGSQAVILANGGDKVSARVPLAGESYEEPAVDGRFPDFSQVIPDDDGARFEIGLNAQLLLDLALALGANKSWPVVRLRIDTTSDGKNMPIIVHAGENQLGVIMPCRV